MYRQYLSLSLPITWCRDTVSSPCLGAIGPVWLLFWQILPNFHTGLSSASLLTATELVMNRECWSLLCILCPLSPFFLPSSTCTCFFVSRLLQRRRIRDKLVSVCSRAVFHKMPAFVWYPEAHRKLGRLCCRFLSG